MSDDKTPGQPEQDSFEDNPEAPEGDTFTSPADLRGSDPVATGDDAKAKGDSVHYEDDGSQKVPTEEERPKAPTTEVGDGGRAPKARKSTGN